MVIIAYAEANLNLGRHALCWWHAASLYVWARVDGVMAANHETNENETEPIQTPKQVSSDDYVNGIGTSRIVRRPLANAGVAGGP